LEEIIRKKCPNPKKNPKRKSEVIKTKIPPNCGDYNYKLLWGVLEIVNTYF